MKEEFTEKQRRLIAAIKDCTDFPEKYWPHHPLDVIRAAVIGRWNLEYFEKIHGEVATELYKAVYYATREDEHETDS